MKKDISLSFFCITCLVIIFLGMFSVFSRAFTKIILIKKNLCPPLLSKIIFFDREDFRSSATAKNQSENSSEPIIVDWKELYPFENERSENASNGIQKNEETGLQTLRIKLSFKFAEKVKDKINSWFEENFILRNFWITFSKKLLYSFIGVQHTGIISLGNDGHLSVVLGKQNVSKYANAVVALNKFLKQKGIPFLYVQAPYKISPLHGLHSADSSNQIADEFLQILKDNDIDFIDMREEILKSGKDFYSFFYKTDHHWKAEVGLFACPIIAEKINEIAGIKIDASILAPMNFNFEIFKDSFLGSWGRRLTLAGAKMEDITLITPKKEFELQTEIYDWLGLQRKEHGGFETFIFKEHLQTKESALSDNAYVMYMKGDTNEFIKNYSAQNEYKILFMGDSFTDVVEPFFALSVKEFDSLDLRWFDGSFKTFVEKNAPYNACVLLCNPSAFFDSKLWDFE